MKLRVLVVDDDLWLLSGFRKVFGRDYDVRAATDKSSARSIIKKFTPDVVFVDLLLGWDNGLDVIEELRPLLPDAYIVLMTAYPGKEITEEGFASGADGFLGKEQLALAAALLDRVSAELRPDRRGHRG